MSNKIVVWMQSSMDGRTAGPSREFDWPVVSDELQAHFVETLRDAGMFVYGRNVFEMMASFWPTADQVEGTNELHAEYARIWRPMPKLVVSRTLGTADWNSTVIEAVDPERVRALAGAADGDVYLFGGGETVAAFAEQDLVDEYRVFVHPVVLGGGTPLFGAGGRQSFALVEARTFDRVVVGLRYARVR